MAMSPRRIKVVSAVILAAALGVWYCVARIQDELGDEGWGDWRYALKLVKMRTILALQGRILGLTHEDTLSTQADLVGSLYAHGKVTKVEKEFLVLIATLREVPDPEHLQLFMAQRNLVVVLQRKGETGQAEKELRALIAAQEHALGAENPSILDNRKDLASLLVEQGKHVEAEKEYRAILAIQHESLSFDKFTLYDIYHGFACCLEVQGKLAEALEFIKRAEKGYQELTVIGPQSENPATADRERIEGKLKASQANETVK